MQSDLDLIGAADELEIAVGTSERWVTIWAVVAGGDVYVRTWHRRDTGWYGTSTANGERRSGGDHSAAGD